MTIRNSVLISINYPQSVVIPFSPVILFYKPESLFVSISLSTRTPYRHTLSVMLKKFFLPLNSGSLCHYHNLIYLILIHYSCCFCPLLLFIHTIFKSSLLLVMLCIILLTCSEFIYTIKLAAGTLTWLFYPQCTTGAHLVVTDPGSACSRAGRPCKYVARHTLPHLSVSCVPAFYTFLLFCSVSSCPALSGKKAPCS